MQHNSNKNQIAVIIIILLGCFLVGVLPTIGSAQSLQKQDFESGWDGWTTDNPAVWEVGQPTSGPGIAYNGDNCVATILSGNYPTSDSGRLISPSFTVPNNGILRFYHWYALGDDTARMQISTDGGTTWDSLSENYYTGSNSAWEYAFVDISSYAGQVVQIAFYFVSDSTAVEDGWYIDDISITEGKCGTIAGEHWTIENSPYHVSCDVFIASLTIDPGVTVMFNGDYVFEVIGILTAVGTLQDTIVFTKGYIPNVDTRWQGIFFENTMPGSQLKYCKIEQSKNSGMRIINSIQTIENCLFINNSASYGGGINITLNTTNDTLRLLECVITNDTSFVHGGGIVSTTSTGALELIDCIIDHNVSNPYNTGATIRAGGGIYSEGDIILINCEITNNQCYAYCHSNCSSYGLGGGIYSNGNTVINNSIISGNKARATATGYWAFSYGYGGGLYLFAGSLSVINSIISCDTASAYYTMYGGAIYVNNGTASIENTTMAYNYPEAVRRYNGSVSIENSILYFNYNSGNQTSGTITASYCNIQNFDTTGNSNIDVNPVFFGSDCDPEGLRIIFPSQCIDAGNPDPIYNDQCFPPSLGGPRNDIGAHGGPGACGWIGWPVVYCPGTIDTSLCALGEEIRVELVISNADNVDAGGAMWSDDTLSFQADTAGSYFFTVIASNAQGADTCEVTINVARETPLALDNTNAMFYTTDTSTVAPEPQVIHITSPCGVGDADWEATIIDSDWLQVDKTSGTNPDSIVVSIVNPPYSVGVYDGLLVFRDVASQELLATVNVSFFVESGVDVGDEYAMPGDTVSVPINLATGDSLAGFEIPLTLKTMQPSKVRLLSASIDSAYVDSLIWSPDSSDVALKRVVQNPPMPPDSVYKIGCLYVVVAPDADPELAHIDTTVFDTRSYQFTYASGAVDTPFFSQGVIAIDTTIPNNPPPTIDCPGSTLSKTVCGVGNVCVPLTISNYDSVVVIGDVGSWDSNTLCFFADSSREYSLEINAFNAYGSTNCQVSVQVTIDSCGADSLIFPSTVLAPCNDDTSCVVQTVSVLLTQPIKGVTIPILLPEGVSVCTVSTYGYVTETWQVEQASDSNYLVVSLFDFAGGTIYPEPNPIPLFDILLTTGPRMCNTDTYIHWDTTLSTHPNWSLVFVDTTHSTFIPGFDVARDSTTIAGYSPGESDGIIDTVLGPNLGDLVYIIARIWQGGPDACVLDAMDVNGDCVLNIADVTLFIAYLYQGGEDLRCGCLTSPANTPVVKITDGSIVIRQETRDSYTTVTLNSSRDLRGLELVLKGSADVTPVNILDENFELFSSYDGEYLRVGIVDMQGEQVITQGKHSIIRLDGAWEVVSATVSDMAHKAWNVSLAAESENLPTEYSLSQNYPNPFNPTTVIAYSLPNPSQVKIEIYNLLGQTVATLVDTKQGAGNYTVTWDGRDMYGSRVSSGIYFYRLQADDFVETKKMLLLK